MTDIAIIGPGAIGATVAAHLGRAGHMVTLRARTPVDRLAIVTPDGELIASPRVPIDPAVATPVEWALVCTKAYDMAAAGAGLAGLIRPTTQAQDPSLRNSLHNDLRAGRPLERDARNGVVVRLGERHGVPTPAHRLAIGRVETLAATR